MSSVDVVWWIDQTPGRSSAYIPHIDDRIVRSRIAPSTPAPVNTRGDRSLTLRHFQHNDRPLHETAQEVLKHVARLWGFGVQLESVNAKGDVTKRWSVPAPAGD